MLDWASSFATECRRHGLSPALLKRAFDVCAAAMLVAVFLVPILLIAVALKCTTRGPVLYWSDRIGRGNRTFRMPKFRSMRTGTPEVAPHLLRHSCLTPLGAFLRRTSLDELPQLFSVLRGDMSLVGPRPALFNEHELIALRTAGNLHRLLPGITGWAQVKGRNRLSLAEKVQLESDYLRRQSFWFDLGILARTAWTVARGEGATHKIPLMNPGAAGSQDC